MAAPVAAAAARFLARGAVRRAAFKAAMGGGRGGGGGSGADAAPKINIGGVFGALRSGDSFFSFMTSMDKLNQEVMIGLPKNEMATREDGSLIPMWRLFGILEYGAPNNKFMGIPAPIPPRPAVTRYLRRNRRKINARLGRIVKKLATQKKYRDTVRLYSQFAEDVVREIRLAIYNNRETPNTPATARRKGFNAPLIHFGEYAAAWTYKVTKRRKDFSALQKAMAADKALRRVKIGDTSIGGLNSLWSQLR